MLRYTYDCLVYVSIWISSQIGVTSVISEPKLTSSRNPHCKLLISNHIVPLWKFRNLPIPVASPCKAWVCGRSLSNCECPSRLSIVCFEVQVSVSGLSLVQSSRTKCGVSEDGNEASIIRRLWPTRNCCAMGVVGVKFRNFAHDRSLSRFLLAEQTNEHRTQHNTPL